MFNQSNFKILTINNVIMNDDRLFQAKKARLLMLLGLNMPRIIIQKMLDFSPATLDNYLAILRTNGEFSGNLTSAARGNQLILKLLADMECQPTKISIPEDFFLELKTELQNFINEAEILRIMEYSLPTIFSFRERQFEKKIPTGYQKLITDVMGGRKVNEDGYLLARHEWKRFLTEISFGKINLPSGEKFSWKSKHFVSDIIQKVADSSRARTIPVVTYEVCDLFNKAIDSLLPAKSKQIISDYYGLIQEKKSIMDIAVGFQKTDERIRQIKDDGLRCLRIHILDPNWENIFHMEKEYEQKIANLKKAKAEDEVKLIKLYGLTVNERPDNIDLATEIILLKKVEQLNFSTRARNAFKDAGIDYIYELVEWPEKTFLGFRSLGKKTVQEIKDVLRDNNLSLDMKFTESNRSYFETKITK